MLAALIGEQSFAFLLILVRIAAMVATLPALGETLVPMRIRVGLAAVLTIVLLPIVSPQVPEIPSSPFALTGLIILEIAIGVFIGLLARLMLSSLNLAGTIIAFQSSLAAAQSFDPSQGSQSALLGSFLALFGTLIIFTTGLYHMIIMAVAHSFTLFPPGEMPLIGDLSASITDVVAESFAMGLTIASPFLVYGILFNVALGLMARLMPQLPVFFIAMPANVAAAFVVLMLVLSSMMLAFANYFESSMSRFLG